MNPFTHRRTIIFGETDAAAIVYTPNFANFCMEAAEVWFRENADIDWYVINTEHHMGTPIVHMEFDLFNSLKPGDELCTSVEVSKIGKSSLSLSFEGVRLRAQQPEAEVFRATIVFVFVDTISGTPIAIPQKNLQLIKKYQESCEVTARNG
jgi:4-hydroxybenzoyl-CoA thioesterase